MAESIKAAELPSIVGKELEPSPWLEITQERVNQFANATNDHQFIHVDLEKAKQTPFGGTIAHG
ncbi:MAG: MaoC family dehydratase N-terminal domain-containing protein, partial [Proteobacteria bacterium]|nr:MaoC family dehydratase N-terminal domain-containing protein [Pseudomonadota bacterium]